MYENLKTWQKVSIGIGDGDEKYVGPCNIMIASCLILYKNTRISCIYIHVHIEITDQSLNFRIYHAPFHSCRLYLFHVIN